MTAPAGRTRPRGVAAALLAAAAAAVGVAAPRSARAGDRVAIFDIGGPPKSARAGRYLAERLRSEGARELAAAGWSVLDRTDMVAALGPGGEGCARSGACDDAPGRLGVARFVQGDLASIAGLQLTLELRDAASGKLVRKAVLLAPRVDGLVEDLPDACRKLFGGMGDGGGGEDAIREELGLAVPSDARDDDAPARAEPPTVQVSTPRTDASGEHGTVVGRGEVALAGPGRIDVGQVTSAGDRHLPEVHRCYAEALSRDASLRGELELVLHVTAKGKLKEVEVARDTAGDKALAKCIQGRAKGWRLPSPWGGAVAVTWPLALSPQLDAAAGGEASPDGLAMRAQFGTVEPGQVEGVIFGRIDEVQQCLERGLPRGRSASGGLTLKFLIAPSGRVQKAEVVDDELGAPKVGRCIRSRLIGWPFPKPSGGPALVSFPFTFG